MRLPFALAAAAVVATSAAAVEPAKPIFKQASMNVFRRFPIELRDRMSAYYKDVLGLEPLRAINLAPGQQVMLFRVGTGQIKFAPGIKEGRSYHPGEPSAATGIRVYTLIFPDEAALSARFVRAGLPAPTFKPIGGGRRGALVRDPGGFTLGLVIAPGAPADTYGRVDVGIAVSDLARSRSFYRDFVGLEELPPVRDPLLGVTRYPYRNGTTTISLWAIGKGKPADTGSAGIQYVIGNLDAVNAAALARKVTVEEPLGGVPGFNVRTVWLNDPDGATNYFYEAGAPATK